jgi:glutamate-ammonia-ligase adenylyltransferase
MCDAFGLLDLRFVTLQLSLLADAMVQCCLNLAMQEANVTDLTLSVISLGKHGGEELNYSSDIDLVLICDEDSSVIQRVARLTIEGLAENTPPGFLYRVDLRLRPWGEAGPLVSTITAYADYLIHDAATWEKQAMLKARVVAGDRTVGKKFLSRILPLLFTDSAIDVRRSIQQMKERIESRLRQRGKLNSEVKLGVGSIRDVEFLVQSLQLIHGERESRILSSNTLDSLVRLAEFGLISAAWYRHLRAGYVFLRTVEHSLQLLHNQQTHELPFDQRQLEWLANRMDYPDAATLMRRFDEHSPCGTLDFR